MKIINDEIISDEIISDEKKTIKKDEKTDDEKSIRFLSLIQSFYFLVFVHINGPSNCK